MLKAAIVEDEDSVRSYFSASIQRSFAKRNISLQVEQFSNGDEFLTAFSEHQQFDIIFLDIEMPGLNGIQVCKKIREIKKDSLVVFISNKESLVFDTFEVQPFRFIRKRFFDSLLEDLTTDLISKLEESTGNTVSISEPSTGNIYTFDINSLLYIEAQRKDCCFITKNDSTFIRNTFSSVAEILEPLGFIQVHRSYLVNLRHIFFIGKDSITLSSKETVPVSRLKVEEVKKEFLLFTSK